MDVAGVDRACVMTYTEAPQFNPRALVDIAEAVARYPDRLIGFARLHPWYPESLSLLDRAVRELGMKGLKLHPVGTLAHPASEQTLLLMRRAGELRVPVLFHCGDEPMTTPRAIAPGCRGVPRHDRDPGPHGRLLPRGRGDRGRGGAAQRRAGDVRDALSAQDRGGGRAGWARRGSCSRATGPAAVRAWRSRRCARRVSRRPTMELVMAGNILALLDGVAA